MATSVPASPVKPWLKSYPQGIPPTLQYPEVPLYQLLVDAARSYPQRTALLFFGAATSYASLLDEARRLAGGLHRLGLQKGDRVAIMLPNCPQIVAAYYGVLWAGGVAVMVNPLYTPREVQVQLGDSGARFLIALDLVTPRVMEALSGLALEKVVVARVQDKLPFPLNLLYPLKLRRQGQAVKVPRDPRFISYKALVGGAPLQDPVPIKPKEDLAVLQYTGGTTGTPKGVMLTHFNLVANCTQLRAWGGEPPASQASIVGAIPFFHSYGMTVVMNYGIMTGARILLFPRFETKAILAGIDKYRPRSFPGVPAMYIALSNYPGVERFDLRSIEQCLSGAAPLPAEVKSQFEKLTGARLVEGYGMSEASPATHASPMFGEGAARGVGLPMPDTDSMIVDPDTGAPLPQGETGEIVIRGPQVMRGYWQKPEESAAVLKEGWLHTGDIGHMDQDGYFFITDRKKEMIIVSGFKIYPREVEEVLYQHPAVKEAAAVGLPDPRTTQMVKAFVVLKDGASCSADEIVEWCRKQLAPYKVPKKVEFLKELPKSLIGKVLRRVLVERELAQAADGAREAR